MLLRACIALLLLISCGSRERPWAKDKELHFFAEGKINSLDPGYPSDSYSHLCIGLVYDTLVTYHYLKRPYELVPSLAKELPELSPDGRVYTFHLRDDATFHDDPAFPGGKGRKVVAADFAYALKRLANYHYKGKNYWLVDGRIEGLEDFHAYTKSVAEDQVDLARPVSGIETPDEHTLRVTLTKPFPQMLYVFAMAPTAPVAREAVEYYDGKRHDGEAEERPSFHNHTVGTGPFILRDWIRGARISFDRNPNYRDERYPSEGEAGDAELGLLADAGARIPFLDRIVVTISPERQPLWLNTLRGNLDMYLLPKDNHAWAVDEHGALRPRLYERGMRYSFKPNLDVIYTSMNMEDPFLGGSRKLRQALSVVRDYEQTNRLFYNGTGEYATSLVPPGLAGADPKSEHPWKRRKGRDVELAKRLVAEATAELRPVIDSCCRGEVPGYTDDDTVAACCKGALPRFTYETYQSTDGQQMVEFEAREFKLAGVDTTVNVNTWPEFIEKTHGKRAPMFGMAWLADYPDAENFLQLLYGPNKSPGPNGSNFDDPEYNRLYEQSLSETDAVKRAELYAQMVTIFQREVPMLVSIHRTSHSLYWSWVKNWKPHMGGAKGDSFGMLRYVRIDGEQRDRMLNGEAR